MWVVLLAACVALSLGCSSEKGGPAKLYRMGERAEAGPLIYSVMHTEWQDRIGEGPTARVPQHRFLLLELSVTNSGAGTSAVPAMTLVDARGQTYPELPDGQGVPEWLGYLRSLKPAQTDRGRVLFDVPTGAYHLRVTEDAEPGSERAALIDIPLQLAPSLPAAPGQ